MLGSPDTRTPSPFAPTPDLWLAPGVCVETVQLKKPVPQRPRSSHPSELAKTCHGSRLLQEQVLRMDMRSLQSLVDEVLPALSELAVDKFGNYFIQAVVKVGDERILNKIAAIICDDSHKGVSFAELCTHTFASHVVQVLIARAGESKTVSARLVEALTKVAPIVGSDFLGSICLVHALRQLVTASRLAVGIAPYTRQLAMSRHGHLVVIEALERASSQTLGAIERELVADMEAMVESDFGFRVIVHSLELEKAGKVSPKHSRVRMFVRNLRYNYNCFRLIDFILRNFCEHEAVQDELIPKVIDIIQLGHVPDNI